MNFDEIANTISHATERPFSLDEHSDIGGGCINTAMKITGSGQCYFLKLNDANRLDMFDAEAAGLNDLAAARAIKVPQPICTGICTGVSGSQAFIVLEYLDMGPGANSAAMAEFGEQLAQMHRQSHDQFGWSRENTIGATPQINTLADNWLDFYAHSRLAFQTEMAAERGIAVTTVDALQRIIDQLGDFFSGYQPQASLLHGDLWSGNYGVLASGEPVIFDPATYYGDREADLAMTELFGGFGHDFYAAYNASWPVDEGYSTRKTLYNLYHILNHFNMFGGGYGSQAGSMANRLLASIA